MRDYQTLQLQTTLDRPSPRGRILSRLKRVFREGFWYCHHCEATCEREEGEQGQPAHCERCCSPRIEWCPPRLRIADTELLQPEDLR